MDNIPNSLNTGNGTPEANSSPTPVPTTPTPINPAVPTPVVPTTPTPAPTVPVNITPGVVNPPTPTATPDQSNDLMAKAAKMKKQIIIGIAVIALLTTIYAAYSFFGGVSESVDIFKEEVTDLDNSLSSIKPAEAKEEEKLNNVVNELKDQYKSTPPAINIEAKEPTKEPAAETKTSTETSTETEAKTNPETSTDTTSTDSDSTGKIPR